jgi:methionine--tRNA ligase beta chain
MEEKLEISFDDFFQIDLRIAKVIWAEEVDGADRLLKIKLDVGELGERTVMAGIKQWYGVDELVGKSVVYLANLKPKKLRGVMSQGMIVAAAPFDEKTSEYSAVLVHPGEEVVPGTILR